MFNFDREIEQKVPLLWKIDAIQQWPPQLAAGLLSLECLG